MSGRGCAWCGAELGGRRDSRYCGRRCRQTAFRLRRRSAQDADTGPALKPLRIAYADPPYPGLAARYYRREPTYGGEVDHEALLRELVTFDGWALSTSEKALKRLLPLCPEGARVAPWVKPHAPSPRTYGPHNCWEPVIYVPARNLRPGKRDWLSAMPARGGGTLPGRKPIAFCAFLFGLLGMLPGDELVDMFPGTGIVGRSWRELTSRADPSVLQGRQLSLLEPDTSAAVGDASPIAGGPRHLAERSPDAAGDGSQGVVHAVVGDTLRRARR